MKGARKRARISETEISKISSHVVDDKLSHKIPKVSEITKSRREIGLTTPPGIESSGDRASQAHVLSHLYSKSVVAKIWGVAQKALSKSEPPMHFPEYTKPGAEEYVYREFDFWTSGFFPGSLYLLLERQRNYDARIASSGYFETPQMPHQIQLEYACNWWTENLHQNSQLRTTHDLSFMISPWASMAWKLNHDRRAYETLLTAARTLSERYCATIGCLRSWDTCQTKRYSFLDPALDFLVIIDNMLNLDLIFWAAAELRDANLRDMAISHARTTQREHIREDSSTFHVVNFDQLTGLPKAKMTNQGYSDSSCWSRGQAWAITGFAQTYSWTQDPSFLETSRKCADYFLQHLPESGIPPWDFNAPFTPETPTDTSAAMVACYGMLLLHEALVALKKPSHFLKGALRILSAVCAAQMSPPAKFITSTSSMQSVEHSVTTESGPLEVHLGGPETILLGATINNYEFAPRRWANHGLVYADYYFLLVGNKLLEMGVGRNFSAP